jgi:hypothetical protein
VFCPCDPTVINIFLPVIDDLPRGVLLVHATVRPHVGRCTDLVTDRYALANIPDTYPITHRWFPGPYRSGEARHAEKKLLHQNRPCCRLREHEVVNSGKRASTSRSNGLALLVTPDDSYMRYLSRTWGCRPRRPHPPVAIFSHFRK